MLVPREDFRLDSGFISEYRGRQPAWGPLGYLVYKRTYAELLPDGSTEEFWQTCQRVIEGMYQIQKGHCRRHGLPWNDLKAQRSAQDAFKRMFAFKWLPPGRGMSKMGTEHMFKIGGACLNNCGFFTTQNIGNTNILNAFSQPFCWLMDMSMLGVGVGLDTRGAGTVTVIKPNVNFEPYVVGDSREAWVEYVRVLLESYVNPEVKSPINPDYSEVRPKGARIRGFGGTASGPEALVRLTTRIRKLLDSYIGLKIDSRVIVDIANVIGECVVAGGVRRCLPQGTLVHTSTGLIPIENVKPDMQVMTSKGYSRVTDWVSQGVQPISQITTQMGVFDCTDKHQIAVLTDIDGNYAFKKANELEPGDRMVFVDHPIEGSTSELPPFTYDAPAHSTTCKDITIPPLSTNIAWFLGMLAGNGYRYLTDVAGEISISLHGDALKARDRAIAALQQFGVHVYVVQPDDSDYSFKVRAKSKQLAVYLSQFKVPNTVLTVPPCIFESSLETRSAYVAGLSDADGCFKNRPMLIVTSVYPSYLEEIQAVCASLGIPTRIALHKDKTRTSKGWQPIYHLKLVGETAIDAYKKRVAPFSFRFEDNRETARSQNDYGFPAAMVKAKDLNTYKDGKNIWAANSRQITCGTLQKLTGQAVKLVPIEVLAVEHNVYDAPTFDISVEAHEFVAQGGYLVHNTAEIMFAEPSDEQFLSLKDYTNPETAEWPRWASNNSVFANEHTDFTRAAALTATNGEPGYYFLENAQRYSRMSDPVDNKDHKAMGGNPCLEQTLHSAELCCLVETFPHKCTSYEDYQRTLKFAYLYAKTVTLVPTHCEETNAVMLRNRRIGCSQSGIQDNIVKVGLRNHFKWCDDGYAYISKLDEIYSDWLCIPKSIKKTSVKPSGSISKLVGCREGIHHEKSEYILQAIRINDDSVLLEPLRSAGYRIETAVNEANTVVVYFPVHTPGQRPSETITMWEQLEIAALMQYYWADNQVSITVDFDKEKEGPFIQQALEMYAHRLKGVSFLPRNDHGYVQAPKTVITKEEYEAYKSTLRPYSLAGLKTHEIDDKYCDGGLCTLPPGPGEEAAQ